VFPANRLLGQAGTGSEAKDEPLGDDRGNIELRSLEREKGVVK